MRSFCRKTHVHKILRFRGGGFGGGGGGECRFYFYGREDFSELSSIKLHFHGNYQEWPRQTQPKKGQFMNFSQGHSGTKVQCESCLFSQGKTPEFTKMGEIHELFVLGLFSVWFAGATPEIKLY